MSAPRRLFTIEEVAAMLCVSRQTLWRWRKQTGRLKPVRLGSGGDRPSRLVRYRQEDVERELRRLPPAS